MMTLRQRLAILRPMLLLVAIGWLCAATPAWSANDHLRNQIRQFHSFLQDHPKVSSELRKNPKLANNKKYLSKHNDLDKFLKRHPDVKRELINHPSRVFGNYYRANRGRAANR